MLVDAVGVAFLGRRFAWSEIATAHSQAYGGAGTSRVIGDSRALAAPMAALANGVLIHAFEYDSLRRPGAGVHPGAVLVPAALAIGEEVAADGTSVIAAIVAGCEVMFRIGAAIKHSSEALGFHAPGHTGPFGAAIVAGRLLRLNAEQMTRALGIAGSLCSGSLAFSRAMQGAMVKSSGCTWDAPPRRGCWPPGWRNAGSMGPGASWKASSGSLLPIAAMRMRRC